MKNNEELLQRCFDGDLNDDELKKLFLDLSKDGELRDIFRSLQSLQLGLHSIPKPAVPISLDQRMKNVRSQWMLTLVQGRPAMRRFVSKKFSISVPALAAAIVLMLIGSYVAATSFFVPAAETEYVYVVEMEPIIIKSNYLQ